MNQTNKLYTIRDHTSKLKYESGLVDGYYLSQTINGEHQNISKCYKTAKSAIKFATRTGVSIDEIEIFDTGKPGEVFKNYNIVQKLEGNTIKTYYNKK